MSYEVGWAALNLEMPKRVPRVEFGPDKLNWRLVRAVTGIDVDANSPDDVKQEARRSFIRAWNYDIVFASLIDRSIFGDMQTNMGHAEYAEGGSDYDDDLHCPFTDPEEVLRFNPWQAYGEIDKADLTRRFEEHYKSQCKQFPAAVNMTGIYPTLVTGLTHIFGWEMLLLAAGISPQGFGELANRYATWMQQFYDALAEADVPVVYVHDDMVWSQGAIFHPNWYRAYVFPNIKRYMAPLRESGKKIIFTCDGNYTEFVHDIAACGNHGFWFEIFTDFETIARQYGQTHVMVGNADTRILLTGTKDEVRAEVERCMAIGKRCPGWFMAVSNGIPANTPLENALYYNQVYEELCWR